LFVCTEFASRQKLFRTLLFCLPPPRLKVRQEQRAADLKQKKGYMQLGQEEKVIDKDVALGRAMVGPFWLWAEVAVKEQAAERAFAGPFLLFLLLLETLKSLSLV
jgi:hypothetical protein